MKTITVDGRSVTVNGESNVLQVVRAAGIDLPTFCYHSELSIYGACRMCIVDIEGKGVAAACHTPPEDGMVVRTNTAELRRIRRVALELLLANHDRDCTSCDRSRDCQLQELANRFGIQDVRFGERDARAEIDTSSPALVRDPNKCILCGDCVRTCDEVQGLGVLDFAYRGSKMVVTPAFNKELGDVECVNCGQCAAVCPTGALIVKNEVSRAWQALDDPDTTVVVQVAPAVRVALGEEFDLKQGESVLGKISTALKHMGVDKVFDTSFTADLTVIEESQEFLQRLESGTKLPLLTSCCPAWVKFVEQYYPEFLDHLSTCRSPQQMFGALVKKHYAEELGVKPDSLFMISVMPCTAKKFEAEREEFRTADRPDVDLVLTTQELARMIREAGLDFGGLEPTSLDMPFGFYTGAGLIFGVTGGVSEAVLRYAHEAVSETELEQISFHQVRGLAGVRKAEADIGGKTLRLGVVHGLANARSLLDEIQAGTVDFDLIEVMACPGGCIGGGGQPITRDAEQCRRQRGQGLYNEDQLLQMHKAQQNPLVDKLYAQTLGAPGGEKAHAVLHTHYGSRRRIEGSSPPVEEEKKTTAVDVQVCVGTSCYLKGSVDLMKQLSNQLEQVGCADQVRLRAAFCCQRCAEGPNVVINDTVIGQAHPGMIPDLVQRIRTELTAKQR